MLEVFDEDSWHQVCARAADAQDEECHSQGEKEPQELGVSVHALSGGKLEDTIKIQEEAKGKVMTILIDTGSTHSFIEL